MPKDLAADDPKITPGRGCLALYMEDIKFETLVQRFVESCEKLFRHEIYLLSIPSTSPCIRM